MSDNLHDPERVKALTDYHILDTPPELAFDDIVKLAATICQTPVSLITFVDSRRQWFKAKFGMEELQELPLEPGFCPRVVEEGKFLLIPDTLAHSVYAENIVVRSAPHVRFYAATPLISPHGQVLGTLCVLGFVPHQLNAEQIEALEALGRQVISQLELRRQAVALTEALRERQAIQREIEIQAHREKLSHQITRHIRDTLDMDVIVQAALEELGRHLQLDRCYFAHYAAAGWVVTHSFAQIGIELGLGSSGPFRSFNSPVRNLKHTVVVVNDGEQYDLLGWREDVLVQGARSWILVPTYLEEKLFGVICCHQCDRQRQWQTADIELVRHVADQLSIAGQHAQHYRRSQVYGQELETLVEQRTRDLAIALREAQLANTYKSEFLTGVSHELRTPLTTILGFARLLHEQFYGDLNEKQQQYIGLICESGQHLLNLINDLLDLSRLDAGHTDLSYQVASPVDLCEQTIELLSQKALEQSIHLHFKYQLPSHQQLVLLETRLVFQILVNLVSNALKFTPAGGEVEVYLTVLDHMLCFTVTDTGIGIPRDYQDRIFDPFYQVNNPARKRSDGTGLGLSLCKRFAELMSGAIEFESQEGVGSTFRLRLPFQPLEIPPQLTA